MISPTELKVNWNCPSDRELLLRSKLNKGWSIRSYDIFHKSSSLSESEMKTIENVLERASKVNALEEKRIQRMIGRVENMKKHIHSEKQKACSMCSESFGFFTSPVSCFDCSKAVCEKCRVDTHNAAYESYILCKICSENRELWKKSGAWFYQRLPSFEYNENEIGENENLGWTAIWEHRAPEIVRMQSYEQHENYSENMSFKKWITKSSPDLQMENTFTFNNSIKPKKKFSLDEFDLPRSKFIPLTRFPSLSSSCPSFTENIIKPTSTKIHRKLQRSNAKFYRGVRKQK